MAVLNKDSEDEVIVERKQELEDEYVEVIYANLTVDTHRSFMLVIAYMYVPPEKKKKTNVRSYQGIAEVQEL